jgi:hypothetical protein
MSRDRAEWDLGEDEVRGALALPARDRHILFVQLVCDWEETWGLRNPDGWVLARGPRASHDPDGVAKGGAFPLWPHSELARLCARGPWEDAAPEAIPLDELLESLLPLLAEEGLQVAVFPAPDGDSRLTSPEELRRDLEAELALGA